MNLKGYRVAMAVIAAAFLAMMLAGCSSDDNGAPMVEPMVTPDPVTPDPDPEPPAYDPSQPGGTQEGVEGRAAAQRIVNAVGLEMVSEALGIAVETIENGDNPLTAVVETDFSGEVTIFGADEYELRIRSGVAVEGLVQAPLGMDPQLSLSVTGGPGLSTAEHSADMEAPEIDGYTGVSLMRAGPGPLTQTALVYSDAERSVRAFGDVYRYNVMMDGEDPTSESTRTHLLIGPLTSGTPATVGMGVFANVSLEHGLSTTAGDQEREVGDPDEPEPSTVRGAYDGVDGLYSFNGGTTIMLGDDGTTVTLDGEAAVTFRADDPETLLPDTDYLAFGVWTEVPDNPTLANPGRVRPFATGSATPYNPAAVEMLEGTASYSGGAVGHYATRAQGGHTVDYGRFTASSSLTANFDDGGKLLSGEITDFMTDDGTPMVGWLVNLNVGHMDVNDLSNGPVTNPGIDIDGMTSGTTGSLSWSGVWEAWMFGNNQLNHPTGVAGNFQAEAGTAQPVTTPEARIDQFNDQGFAGVVGSFAGR